MDKLLYLAVPGQTLNTNFYLLSSSLEIRATTHFFPLLQNPQRPLAFRSNRLKCVFSHGQCLWHLLFGCETLPFYQVHHLCDQLLWVPALRPLHAMRYTHALVQSCIILAARIVVPVAAGRQTTGSKHSRLNDKRAYIQVGGLKAKAFGYTCTPYA